MKPLLVDTPLQWTLRGPTEQFMLDLNLCIVDNSLQGTPPLMDTIFQSRVDKIPLYNEHLFKLIEHFMMIKIKYVAC